MEKKNKKGRRALIVLLAVAIPIAAGCVWQAACVSVEKKNCPLEPVYVETGSYTAACYIRGEGDTLAVFIAGNGTPSAYTDFYYLQNALVGSFKTVSFDHEGSGFSTASTAKRTASALAGELSCIIDACDDNAPVILICHSLGSLEAIAYADAHPDRVKGIVFLDSGSPEFYASDSEAGAAALGFFNSVLRTCGVVRLLGECGILLPVYGENIRGKALPDELKRIDKELYYRFTGNPAARRASSMMNENGTTLSGCASVSGIPALILTSDSGASWEKAGEELAAIFNNHTLKKLPGSGHYLHQTNREDVIAEITEFTSGLASD